MNLIPFKKVKLVSKFDISRAKDYAYAQKMISLDTNNYKYISNKLKNKVEFVNMVCFNFDMLLYIPKKYITFNLLIKILTCFTGWWHRENPLKVKKCFNTILINIDNCKKFVDVMENTDNKLLYTYVEYYKNYKIQHELSDLISDHKYMEIIPDVIMHDINFMLYIGNISPNSLNRSKSHLLKNYDPHNSDNLHNYYILLNELKQNALIILPITFLSEVLNFNWLSIYLNNSTRIYPITKIFIKNNNFYNMKFDVKLISLLFANMNVDDFRNCFYVWRLKFVVHLCLNINNMLEFILCNFYKQVFGRDIKNENLNGDLIYEELCDLKHTARKILNECYISDLVANLNPNIKDHMQKIDINSNETIYNLYDYKIKVYKNEPILCDINFNFD